MEDHENRWVDEQSNVLNSANLPQLRVKIDSSFSFIGNLNFILYEGADVQIFLFARHEGKNISRLFKFHFESLLPEIEQPYQYPGSAVVQHLGQHPYQSITELMNLESLLVNPESDGMRTLDFLGEQGYRINPEVMGTRFMRVVDEAQRHAFFISYYEDINQIEMNVSNFSGVSTNPWVSIGKDVMKRAVSLMQFIEG